MKTSSMTIFSEHFETYGWKMGHNKHLTIQENMTYTQVLMVRSYTFKLCLPIPLIYFLSLSFLMRKAEFLP